MLWSCYAVVISIYADIPNLFVVVVSTLVVVMPGCVSERPLPVRHSPLHCSRPVYDAGRKRLCFWGNASSMLTLLTFYVYVRGALETSLQIGLKTVSLRSTSDLNATITATSRKTGYSGTVNFFLSQHFLS